MLSLTVCSFCGLVFLNTKSDFRRPLENPRARIGIDISPMPVRHGQTPARRLQSAGKRTVPESRTPINFIVAAGVSRLKPLLPE
jgi:hypothetical protein